MCFSPKTMEYSQIESIGLPFVTSCCYIGGKRKTTVEENASPSGVQHRKYSTSRSEYERQQIHLHERQRCKFGFPTHRFEIEHSVQLFSNKKLHFWTTNFSDENME